jgi:hypothetical protein
MEIMHIMDRLEAESLPLIILWLIALVPVWYKLTLIIAFLFSFD